MLKREARKRKWVRRIEWVSNRIQALFWVGLASLVIYKTNFFRQLWENEEISSMFMNLTLLCLGLNCAIMAKITIINPLMGKGDDIEKENPGLIPVLTIAGIFLPIFLTLAIWPIWGFLSPIYVFILFFGYIFALTFLPDGHFGTLFFWILMIGTATLSHTLPHAGHEHAW